MKHETWLYNGGFFKHTGQFDASISVIPEWTEFQPDESNPKEIFIFKEILRDDVWIYLFDHLRRIWVALPTGGGTCFFQWWLPEGTLPQQSWNVLYQGGLAADLR